VVGEQRADLVAAQHPPAVRGHRDGAPVGVRVVGHDDVGVDVAASAIARSIAPGSSGLGKATVGKSGSGSLLLRRRRRARGSRPVSSTCEHRLPPTPCRGCRRSQVARARADQAGDRVEVAVDDVVAEGLPGVAAGHVGERPDRRDPAAISASAGGTIWLPSPR
jgi:hypothetical protein